MANDESQAIEGYGCQCGYRCDSLAKLRKHFVSPEVRHDPKGTHKSLGRLNLATGEVVLPPWPQRTLAEKQQSNVSIREPSPTKKAVVVTQKITENISEASEIKFVPRVYTATLSPIVQTAFVAAQRVWKWRSDMPFVNFLDTVIYNFFKEHGITLAAYVVDHPEGEGEQEVHGGPDGNGSGDSKSVAEVMTQVKEESNVSGGGTPAAPGNGDGSERPEKAG